MNLRWIDKNTVKLIEELSNEFYGKNRRGNKQRLVRDAILYANENKNDFVRWMNIRKVPISQILDNLYK